MSKVQRKVIDALAATSHACHAGSFFYVRTRPTSNRKEMQR